MIIDLHTHSNCSDGILSPRELMSRAKSLGVDALALTDHDTLAGLAEAQEAAGELAMTLIPGIEFSSRWGKTGVHIVGLDLDIAHAGLQTAIAQQQGARERRNQDIAVRLEKLGLADALARAQAIAGESQLGRPHFAQLLVEAGWAKDIARAFARYLGAGKRAGVQFDWPDIAAIVGVITEAGGVAVLAHPAKYDLTRTKLRALISDFAEAGGQAIEVISGRQPSGLAQDLACMASGFGLCLSCGSDFHRPDSAWQELGNFESLPAVAPPVWSLFRVPLEKSA